MNTINNSAFRSIIYLILGNTGSFALGSSDLINVEKFKKENPIIPKELETLSTINPEDVRNKGKKISSGAFGEIYAWTAGKGNPSIVVKFPSGEQGAQDLIDDEVRIGQNLKDRFDQMGAHSLYSDYQGLPMLVIPTTAENGVEVQEKINGIDGYCALYGQSVYDANTRQKIQLPPLSFFANGYVDNPEKAIEQVAGFILALYALHKANKVHHDLKLQNIMFEKCLPIRRLSIQQQTPQKEYRIRLIDFGGTVDIGAKHVVYTDNGAPEYVSPRPGEKEDRTAQPSYDIYTVGTMLPTLLFGQGADRISAMFYGGRRNKPSPFVHLFRVKENKLIREKENKPMQQQYKDEIEKLENKKSLDQARLEIAYKKLLANQARLEIAYKELLAKREDWISQPQSGEERYRQFTTMQANFTKQWDKLQQKDIILKKRKEYIENCKLTLEKNYQENIQKIMSAEGESSETQDELQEIMRKYMMDEYTQINRAMRNKTGQSYSQKELKTLAYLTADCLSLDPKKRPTAGEILEELTKLLNYAHSGGYTFEELTEGERKSLNLTQEERDAPNLSPEQIQKLNENRKAQDLLLKTRDLTLVNAWKQKQLSKRGQKLLGTWIQRLITTQDLQKIKTYDQNKKILLNKRIPEQYKIWIQKLFSARIRELASETQQ